MRDTGIMEEIDEGIIQAYTEMSTGVRRVYCQG
jgi:hypothetical protein